MRKLWALVFSLMIFAAAGETVAKVCFLPGVLSGDGCLDEDALTRCNGFERTTPCPSGYEQSTCVSGGTTYYHCSCRNDNVLVLGSQYKCLGTFDPVCGCAAKDTVCNTSLFPYEGCSQYPGTVPSTEFCRNPSDGRVFYRDCKCPSGVYPYDCRQTGLKEPSVTSYCEEPTGEKHFSFCICDDNWSTSPCGDRNDGCTTQIDHVYNGLDTCYNCSAETCPKATDINVETYWCNALPLQTDCKTLGYTYIPDGKCADGTVGVKCPFDKNYMFCPSDGVKCEYSSKSSCEQSHKGFVCCLDYEGCYIPTGCASGYVTAEDRLLDSHVYENYTYQSLSCYKPVGCQEHLTTSGLSGATCQEFSSSGFKCYLCRYECAEGYAKTAYSCGSTGEQGWELGALDSKGCGLCKPRSCPEGTSTSVCESGLSINAGHAGNETCYKCLTVIQQQCPVDKNGKCCTSGKVGLNGLCSLSTTTSNCVCPDSSECAEGYARSVLDCGVSGSLGWTIENKDENGCGICTKKVCDSSYNFDGACSSSAPNPILCSTCWEGDKAKSKHTTCRALGYKCDCVTYCSDTGPTSGDVSERLCLCINIKDPVM